MLQDLRPIQIVKQILLIIFFSVSVGGDTPTGALRLVDGPGICAGRVEIFYNNRWGAICHDFWNSSNSLVVCRQLDCGNILFAPGNSFYGMANGIWMDDVRCSGNESALSNCAHNGWGLHNCHAMEAVGVICSEHLPKPTISAGNNSGDPELQCILPRLYLNVTFYLINMGTNVTVGSVTLNQTKFPQLDHVARFAVSGGEHHWIATYSCRYEVKRGTNYMSPLSEPVCVVYQDHNGTKFIEILHNSSRCASGADSSTWSLGTTIPSQTAWPNSGLPTGTQGNDSHMTAVSPYHVEQTPAEPDTTVVIAVSLVMAFLLLLIVPLVIFCFYRRKPSHLSERDVAQANEYSGRELHTTNIKTTQEKGPKGKIKFGADLPSKVEAIYESVSDPTDGAYETTIFYIDTSSAYESLSQSTKSKDVYEVLK